MTGSRFALVLTLALAALVAISLAQPQRVFAAGGDPIIHWDSSMIYPGQNNGYPWGPVGEPAVVHGEKFTAATVLGLPVKLSLVPGDVNNPPGGDSSYNFCKLSPTKIPIGQANVDGTGAFDFNFQWPAAAGSGVYSVCAYNTLDGFPVGNIDDGPFTVLSSAPPSLAISRTSVPVGETITVTGKNWTPPQDVNVYIGACVDCDGPVIVAGTAHSSGLHSGTFSIMLTIPASATVGDYVAGANAHSGLLDVGPAGAKHLKIIAAVATPTPEATATSEATVTSGGSGNGNGSAGSSNGLLVSPVVLVLAGAGVLALLLIILLIIALSRRGARKTPPDAMGSPLPGWGGSGPQAGGYPGYGADAAPMGGSVQQNWQTPPQGWGDQTPPTVARDMPQGDDSPTRATFSHTPGSAYPPAPPVSSPPAGGDTPTQPGLYNDTPPNPYNPFTPDGN